MQTGVIDALEWVGPYNDLAFGFHQIAKYYYYPGWSEPGPALELIINKDAYQTLPDDLKAIVESAARAVNQDVLDEYTARNNEALVTLVEEHGVELKKLPDDVVKELRRISGEIIQEIAEDSEIAGRIASSIKAFQKQAAAYHAISEEAYYEARSQ